MQLLAQQRTTPTYCKVKTRLTTTAAVRAHGPALAAQAAVPVLVLAPAALRVRLTALAPAQAGVLVVARVRVQVRVQVVPALAPVAALVAALVRVLAAPVVRVRPKGYGIWQFH